jgi:hypothetical protein
MIRRPGKDEILKRLLETALIEWGKEVEEMQSAFEAAAEGIWKVEEFQLDPEEEPAILETILEKATSRRGKK